MYIVKYILSLSSLRYFCMIESFQKLNWIESCWHYELELQRVLFETHYRYDLIYKNEITYSYFLTSIIFKLKILQILYHRYRVAVIEGYFHIENLGNQNVISRSQSISKHLPIRSGVKYDSYASLPWPRAEKAVHHLAPAGLKIIFPVVCSRVLLSRQGRPKLGKSLQTCKHE